MLSDSCLMEMATVDDLMQKVQKWTGTVTVESYRSGEYKRYKSGLGVSRLSYTGQENTNLGPVNEGKIPKRMGITKYNFIVPSLEPEQKVSLVTKFHSIEKTS